MKEERSSRRRRGRNEAASNSAAHGRRISRQKEKAAACVTRTRRDRSENLSRLRQQSSSWEAMPNSKDAQDGILPSWAHGSGGALGPNSLGLALKKVSGCFYRRRMLASTSILRHVSTSAELVYCFVTRVRPRLEIAIRGGPCTEFNRQALSTKNGRANEATIFRQKRIHAQTKAQGIQRKGPRPSEP